MNRIITSIVILLILTAGSFAAVGAVNGFTDKISEMIDEVEKAFVEGDTQKCTEAAEALQDEWNEFMKYSVLVNDLGHALEITSSIAELYSFAQESNEEIYAACDRAQAQIKLFKDMQNPTFWKIL